MSALQNRVVPSEARRVRNDLDRMNSDIRQGNWIRRGDTGSEVTALQRQLKAAGLYSGAIDGRFDSGMDQAVRAFQKARGLVVDGLVGPQTLRALRSNNLFVDDKFERSPAHAGQRGTDILRAEKLLGKAGYNVGKIDGVFDARTAAAVKAYRAHEAKLPDGSGAIDHAVYNRLNGINEPAKPKPAKSRTQRMLEQFDKTPPKNDYTKTKWREVKMNKRTKEMMQRAEFIMRHKYGHKNFSFSFSQGSYTTACAASGMTHAGGGALDVHTAGKSKHVVDDMVRSMREAGFAAWSRGRGHDSFAPHIHAIAIGDRQMSSAAHSQVHEYAHGGDGLVGSLSDPDRNLGRHLPKWARSRI